ncbi:MAG: hypothetical protein M1819_006659 [Sarea resinae]|nr:MAG: hypothetical protein M1819_006659 [Sarea resinae]
MHLKDVVFLAVFLTLFVILVIYVAAWQFAAWRARKQQRARVDRREAIQAARRVENVAAVPPG